MSSDQSDETSYQQSQPILCANNCGFFGNASTMNLCSKCFREVSIREEQAQSAKEAMKKSLNPIAKIEEVRSQIEIVSPIEASIEAPISVDSGPSSTAVSGGEDSAPVNPNRCRSCKKKVGLVGFKCRCGSTFCRSHRYPEDHECCFDFKELGRSKIEKANPVVKGSKLEKL